MKKLYFLQLLAFIGYSNLTFAQQAGDLDSTFSGDGIQTTSIGSSSDNGYSTVIQTDGKIVVAGYYDNGSNQDFAVVRYNSDGSIDNTFSGDGIQTTSIGSSNDVALSIALQDDGKIVLAGYSFNGTNTDFAVVRYNNDGSLDSTFSGDGKQTSAIGSSTDNGWSVAIQTDGKIIVAGSSDNGTNYDFAIVRYKSDGTLDTTFSGDGIQTTNFLGNGEDIIYSIALQSDGKIVAAGHTYNGTNKDFGIARYNNDGALDSTFSGYGKVTTAIGASNDYGRSVAIQNDGKIVVAGYSDTGTNNDFTIVRYNSDGSLDSTLNGDGIQTTSIGNDSDEGYSVALQSDGKIVVAGYAVVGSGFFDFALVRYNNNGSLDSSFSGDGIQTTIIGSFHDYGHSVVLQPDGKIVMAGEFLVTGTNWDFAVVRYLGNTPPPTISAYSPLSGPIGTTVMIFGSNFNPAPANNIVFFGATKANVLAATDTSLTVTVPNGATYQYISVTDISTNLTAYSTKQFILTFDCGSFIDTTSFDEKVDLLSGSKPYDISICDFDGNGKPDLAVANGNSNTVSVFRNIASSGMIDFDAKEDFNTSVNPLSIAAGDIDGDGKIDLAIANGTSNTVSILINTSTANTISFATKVDFQTGTQPYDVSVGDIDGDGKSDIAVVNKNSTTVSIFRNTGSIGTISFAAKVDLITGNDPRSVSTGDLDGDGKPDLIVANTTSNTISIFRNIGSAGTISFAPKDDFNAATYPEGVSIGDLDGDGTLDLAVVNYGSNSVSVFRNSGSIGIISFAAKIDFTTGTGPQSVSVGDLDGDGRSDLAVTNIDISTVSIFKNIGSSGVISFDTKVDFTTGTNPFGIANGDLNGDGRPEVVVANWMNNNISIFENKVNSGPSVTISHSDVTCSLSNTNGTANVTASSGTSPYIYLWSNGDTTSQISNLPTGDYTVTVTDSSGCSTSGTATIGTNAPGSWTQKANFGGTARNAAVGFSIGTKGYIGTGYDGTINKKDFWEWDQATNVWTQKADFGGTARSGAVGFSIGTKGYIGTGNDGALKQDFWQWDQETNVWTQRATFGGAGRKFAVGFSIGSKGYIGTGWIASYIGSQDFWEYDTTLNSWTQKANFGGTARFASSGFSIGNKGYIGTGMENSTGKPVDFWEWDQTNNTWLSKANFGGVGRPNAVGFSIGTKGYFGTGDGGPEKDFWEWDQGTDSWAQKTNFGGTARTTSIGFCIGTKGYIGTGYDGPYHNDFYEFDPSGGLLSVITSQTNTPCNSNSGTAITSASGGYSPYSYIWDNGDTTSQISNLQIGTYSVTVIDSSGCTTIDSVNVGAITPGSWTQKSSLSGAARAEAVGFSIGNKGYIGTGADNDFWEWDQTSNIWTQKATLNATPRGRAVGFSIGVKGYVGTGNAAGLKDFWEYDPSLNTWSQKQDFGGTARDGSIGFSIGSKGYIGIGRSNTTTMHKDFWEYDPSNNTWTQKSDFAGTARWLAAAFVIGTKGYVGTGLTTNVGGDVNDFWEYNQSNNTWSQKANFNGTARHSSIGFSIGGKGYVGTGTDGSFKQDFWEYNPNTDAWMQLTTFIGTARQSAVSFSIGNKGYIGTGNDGVPKTDFYEFDPSGGALSATISKTNITCNGASNGTATAIANGGYSPYSYLWSNGDTTSQISNLAVSIYSVTVTDSSGCTAIATDTISEPAFVPTYTDTIALILHDGINCIDYPIVKIGNQWWMKENVNSRRYADGASLVDGTGAGNITGDYTTKYYFNYNDTDAYSETYGKLYTWAAAMNGAASNDFVPSGVLGVCPFGWHLPSDSEWKGLEMELGMSQAQADSIGWRGTDEGGKLKETGTSHWVNPNTGATNSSGFTAIPGGGSWVGSFEYISSNGYWWTATESGMGNAWARFLYYQNAQVYRYDNNKENGFSVRCVKDMDLLVNLTLSISNVTNATCNGANNGAATIIATGGQQPYIYLWTGGQTDSIASGLSSGTYFVTVTDANSNTAIDSVTITEPSAIITSTIATICSNDSILLQGNYQTTAGTYYDTLTAVNGCDSILETTLTVNQFSISNTQYSICSGDSIFIEGNYQSAAGTYYDTLSSVNGCDSIIITTLTIYPASSIQNPASICNGDSILLQGNYQTTSGTYYDTLSSINGCDSVITTTLSILQNSSSVLNETACNSYTLNSQTYNSSGTYIQTLTNADGCDSTITLNLTINQSANQLINQSICSGDSIFLQGSYQTIAGNYYDTLSSSNGCDSIIATTLFIFQNTSSTLTETACDSFIFNTQTYNTSGTFTQTLINSTGCDSTITLNLTINQSAIQPINQSICNGDSIFLQGSFQTIAGNYYDTLSSVSGCDSVIATTLTVSSGITISFSLTNVTCNGGSDGTATATATGGNTPYSYLWSNGASTSQISNLTSQIYFVTATDNNSCSANDSVIISEPTVILSMTTVSSACNDATGSATVLASGGVSPYYYQWSSGDLSPTADSLPSGIYFVTVTDANSCQEWTIASISDLNSPVITVNSVTDVTCYNQSNGAINISVSSGVSPYTYSWSNGATVQDISNLFAGPYEIVVTGGNGCNAIQNINVQQPLTLSIAMNVTNSLCASAVGAINAIVTGGTTPYFYSWIPGGQTTSSINNLQAGNYAVLVQDLNGCSKNAFAAVTAVDWPSVVIDSILPAGCGTDGSVYISVSGGTTPYSYNWSDSSITEDLISVPAGNYGLTLTDNSGCVSAITTIVQTLYAPVTPVCLVTVDTSTITNKVVWEENQSSGIVSFNIYRESTQAGIYFPVGNVPIDDLSVFTDSTADPKVHSWRYKISAIDSCGNESPMSTEHKTIHLVVSTFGSDVFLIWDDYEGFSFGTYYIYRYADITGWQILDSISSNLHSYTDTSASGLNNLTYFIEAKHPDGCTATKVAENHNSSRSNIKLTSAPVVPGFAEIQNVDFDFQIYPNPNDGTFTIELRTSDFQLPASIKIYNVLGEIVYQTTLHRKPEAINLKQSAGIYYIQFISGNRLLTKKLIIE